MITVGLSSMIAMIVLTVIYYVVMANYVMDQRYQANIRKCRPDFDYRIDLS